LDGLFREPNLMGTTAHDQVNAAFPLKQQLQGPLGKRLG
jgi:hypothetical protein